MAGNNPVALPLLLTAASLVAGGYSWANTPHKLPLWWSVHGHPVLWAPKWVGLLLFPILGLLIPYIMYQVASRDDMLNGQSGESAYAIANIIGLPSVLLFVEYVLVYLKAAQSSSHNFPSAIFTSNLALWPLFWLGYNLQFVAPNTSIGVPVFTKDADLWTTIHQRSGWGLMAAGVVLFVFALACPAGLAFFVLSLVIWLGAYVVVVLYSYYLSQRPPHAIAADQGERELDQTLREPLVSEA
ncbi:hypothetical protein GOP47_0020942 [Adiantum capillus-veneris]|uniref:DUF1648 domain-containing protein n=1 Tax=Adiantum capillus-veneris TaxID=13818 RepID=A0A9D4UAX5_ADICA|nr:hypothetical protein GOP47_0020942 [Adiantum capillus-veneris]